jgi:hypothetical protein
MRVLLLLLLADTQQQQARWVWVGLWRGGPGLSSMPGPSHEEAKVRRVAQVRGWCSRLYKVLLLAPAEAACAVWAAAKGVRRVVPKGLSSMLGPLHEEACGESRR